MMSLKTKDCILKALTPPTVEEAAQFALDELRHIQYRGVDTVMLELAIGKLEWAIVSKQKGELHAI
jgi:hypothetical protein